MTPEEIEKAFKEIRQNSSVASRIESILFEEFSGEKINITVEDLLEGLAQYRIMQIILAAK